MNKNNLKKKIALALTLGLGLNSINILSTFGETLNLRPGQIVRLNSSVKAYYNAESANHESGDEYKIYNASEYYVYKVADGATNITRNPSTPGGWVSNSDISVINEVEETTSSEETEETTESTKTTIETEVSKENTSMLSKDEVIIVSSPIKAYRNASLAISGSGTYVTYGAAKYYVYKSVPGAINISRVPGIPGGWVSNNDLSNVEDITTTTKPVATTSTTKPVTSTTAKTTNAAITTVPTNNTSSIVLKVGVKAYSNAQAAVDEAGNYVNYGASKYFIYKTAQGATNISKTPGVAGGWVSNEALESAKNGITVVEKETTTTTSSQSTNSTLSSKETLMLKAGIDKSNWKYVDFIVEKESGWDYTISNSYSGAYGLPQALPGSKMKSAGSDWRTNPVTQLKWMDSYVNSRYGGWQNAYNFWLNNHWY